MGCAEFVGDDVRGEGGWDGMHGGEMGRMLGRRMLVGKTFFLFLVVVVDGEERGLFPVSGGEVMPELYR